MTFCIEISEFSAFSDQTLFEEISVSSKYQWFAQKSEMTLCMEISEFSAFSHQTLFEEISVFSEYK
jgi:hypothetical protein